MSYDLHLDFHTSAGIEEITKFLSARGNYQLSGKQAVYHNAITGVYFTLAFSEEKRGLFRKNTAKADININYCRPSFFGLEAEIEITPLLQRFPCQIHDPQMNGMGDGPYSKEGFLRGWNAGNEFGVDAILSQSSDPILYLPSSQLHNAWRWNYDLPLRQAKCGDKQFVPQILYMLIAGRVYTIAVWGDALPAVLPEVDFVLLARQEGANSVFGFASWDEVAKLLTANGYQNGPDGFNLDYAIAPRPIADFALGFAPVDRSELVKLSPDRVLDQELVQRQLAARQN
ncbi:MULTISPECIES: hypothetical protein [unclassified Rhizobium]|uniref:hypothetical protein n=1 Tax=unclassified Rhizobium TaxID=2613769 RepID=UPI000EA97BA5|nr:MULTISPECIES: hypothetical protein [unclassified Rhizobium]AYG68684.1 hypothetical protein CCGE531_21495 [Rhizobium sp. CCGE531]AYG75070.1 hypothetical protein CCGE532_20980 [Rhizobium sp. CCGE532]